MDRSSKQNTVLRCRSSAPGSGRRPPSQSTTQGGFSLIEALVTLAILSVALLGLAFLQAQGMQLNTSAYARTQASILVTDIIDRMRLNPANSADYVSTAGDATPADCDLSLAPAAQNDLDCWYGRLQDNLPGGDGAITQDGTTGVLTVTVQWEERPGGRREDDFDPSSLTQAELDELRIQQMAMSVAL